MPDPSDRDLAFRARRGETEAFGELVRRYQASVFNVCYRLLGERREADYRDVLGEVCLKRLNNPALAEIFPDYAVTMRGFLK